MVRSTSLTTIAANDAAQWFILVDVADIPTTLNLTTGDDQAADFTSYRAWLSRASFAIGSSLDWRGGLAADDPFTINVIQGFDSADGTTGNNTFERLFALYDSEAYSGTYREATILNGGSGSVAVKLGSYNSTPTGVSTTIYTGVTRNLALSDFGELQLEIGRGNRWLDKTFLARFGREPSGEENYDTVVGRTLVSQTEGQSVPICYGNLTYARGYYVHEENTQDMTARSGLIICYSDIRYIHATNGAVGRDVYELWVYDPSNDEMVAVQKSSLEASNTEQYYCLNGGSPAESNLAASGLGEGIFVSFTANDDNPTVTNDVVQRLAGGGKLLLKRTVDLLDYTAGPATMWTDIELGADGDSATSAYSTNTVGGISPVMYGHDRYYRWICPQLTSKGKLYRAIVRPKYAHSGSAGDQFIRPYHSTGAAVVSPVEAGSASASYDAWTGADPGWTFKPGTGSMPSDQTPAEFSRGGQCPIWIGTSALATTLVGRTDVYGAQLDVWWDVDWKEYRNKVYATVEGVIDATYQMTAGVGEALRNPAEVFWHFTEEVCGGSAYTASSHLDNVATDMDNDGLRCDVQLVDGEQTAAEFLDDFALQFMSWILPTDDGSMKLIYRASDRASFIGYDGIVDLSKVIKGTISTYWTDADELYSGVLVNYGWNDARSKYEGQWAITRTGHEIATNVTSPTDYQGLADMVRSDVERVLDIDAYMIQDADTAELLCKWLIQQHCRRRQIIEFETHLEEFDIEVGDRLIVDLPQVRIYASGDTATAVDDGFGLPGTVNLDAAVTKWPSGATLNRTVHLGDIMVIENSSPGYVSISPDGSGGVNVNGYEASAIAVGSTNPFRVIPSFHVLEARVVYDSGKGPRMRFRVIEAPIIRAGATSI